MTPPPWFHPSKPNEDGLMPFRIDRVVAYRHTTKCQQSGRKCFDVFLWGFQHGFHLDEIDVPRFLEELNRVQPGAVLR